MKKIFCLVLCMIFVFSFAACGKDGGKKIEHSIDIEYYAKLGQINDLEYKLGDSIENTKSQLNKTTDDHGESNYYDYTSGDYTVMTDGAVCACYKTDDEAAGITHIVKYGDAYGFTVGDVSTQIRDVMSGLGYDATEREATREDVFFLPAGADMTVLEYKIKDTNLLFVFQEHALSATLISK